MLPTIDSTTTIGVIGLGYVGLPVALAFSNQFNVLAWDKSDRRISALRAGQDTTNEVTATELQSARNCEFTPAEDSLRVCNVLLVTVPTPINQQNEPDLTMLIAASETVGRIIKKGTVVIYESTVYPGATEEVCIPIIESVSGLKVNKTFFVGYSPERINPGDSEHRFENVIKITAGSNKETADFVANLYGQVVKAGIHKAPSIRVAEAAKVIENIQRDLNIALVNEFAQVFERLDIDTGEVLDAANTKWNFLPFRPGLVGGHCIGVDPYYLTHKAESVGYSPKVILSGRAVNNAMPDFVANRVERLMRDRNVHTPTANVLLMGITFKENCPDIRNSKSVDLFQKIQKKVATVDIYDPLADLTYAQEGAEISLIEYPAKERYNAIVVAVAHEEFRQMGIEKIREFGVSGCVIFDVKHVFPKNAVTARL